MAPSPATQTIKKLIKGNRERSRAEPSGDVSQVWSLCEERKKKHNSPLFKHHLTVTALADPHGRQTRCLSGGGGRMDGSAGVDREVRRQRWREMHTEEATKETKTEGFLHIRTFGEPPCGQLRWLHPSMILKQVIIFNWVIFLLIFVDYVSN